MIEIEKKLLLVDGHSLIHRAYHAFPAALSTATGEQTNAVYGFTRMLLEAIHDLKPTHVAVAFDLPGPTFRETMFVGYKRSRVKPDDAMIAQIPRVKEVVSTLGIPIFEVAGYEADDVIGTLARLASTSDHESRRAKQASQLTAYRLPLTAKNKKKAEAVSRQPSAVSENDVSVIILTSDRDLMQLVRGDRVMVKMPERKKRLQATGYRLQAEEIWNEERFMEEWGFRPELLPDYKAFAGDQSDDIPGVRGVGEKTAKELISTIGTVNDVYRQLGLDPTLRDKGQRLKAKGQTNLNSLSPRPSSLSPATLRKLAEDQESAQMSKKLATIDTDVPIKLDWGEMEVHGYDKELALKLFEELQFRSLIPKLPNDSFEESVQEVLF